MEQTQQITSTRQSLSKIRQEIRQTRSLDALRRQFERLHALRRQYLEDFDLQIQIADIHHEVIERARYLRGDTPNPSPAEEDPSVILLPGVLKPSEETALVLASRNDLTVTPRRPAATKRPKVGLFDRDTEHAAEIPPEVPRLDVKTWQTILGIAGFFCIVVLIGFFYLIQTARRLNLPEEASSKTSRTANPAAVPEAPGMAAPAGAPALRLYTDLIPGTATIDAQPTRELVDGELTLDNLAQGHHRLKVAGASGTASFDFEVVGRDAPKVVGTPQANNALVVLVSQQNGRGHLISSSGTGSVLLDNLAAGEINPAGLALAGLGQKDHDLQILRGTDRQRFVVTYTPTPVLTAGVKSDPNTGIALISTGVDGADIFVDNVMLRRKTEHGQARLTLREGRYSIRVHKDGFQDPPAIYVEIKKAEVTPLEFRLLPAAEVASLILRGAPAGAMAFIDREFVAAVEADGSARILNIKPGEHTVELRYEQSQPKKLLRTFRPGESVVLSGSDVTFDKAAAPEEKTAPATGESGAAALEAAPEGARVQRGGGFVNYATPKTAGRYSFSTQGHVGGILKKGKLQWYAGFQDPKNYVLFVLDGKHAETREMRDGKLIQWNRIPFAFDSSKWVQVDMSVKQSLVSARIKTNDNSWMDLGSVSSNGRDFTQDKVGFYIPANDEVAVANFRFQNH